MSFKVGDKVRVVSEPYYRWGGEKIELDAYVEIGAVYVVAHDRDEDGDYTLVGNGISNEAVNEECLELAESDGPCDCPDEDVKSCPEDEEGPVPDISAGRLVVKVELRFFIRDLDVTERIKGLVA